MSLSSQVDHCFELLPRRPKFYPPAHLFVGARPRVAAQCCHLMETAEGRKREGGIDMAEQTTGSLNQTVSYATNCSAANIILTPCDSASQSNKHRHAAVHYVLQQRGMK